MKAVKRVSFYTHFQQPEKLPVNFWAITGHLVVLSYFNRMLKSEIRVELEDYGKSEIGNWR